MKLRAVLVENEEHSLSRLRRLLSEFPQDIEVVGEAADGPSAVETIGAESPDIVFLDIDLPGFNGFRVLDKLDKQPIVIFTTAFNQHALEAFKTHAVDYLLKPIETEAVGRALAKLRAMGCDRAQVNAQVARAIAQLLDSVGAGPHHSARLACKEGDTTVLVKMGEILYFRADNKYTAVHTANREFLIDTPLIDLERKVSPRDFIRIHRSTLVNISWIAEIRRSYDAGMTVLLKDAKGTELSVSRKYADNIRNI
jgi:two-component system, LytTR family, response regulator